MVDDNNNELHDERRFLRERIKELEAADAQNRRAWQALRESEHLYRSLFENMLGGFAYCQMHYDDEGRPQDFTYLSVNGAFETLTGLSHVTGRRVTEVIPGVRESDPELFEIYGRVSKGGKPEQFKLFLNTLGKWFWVSVYSPASGYFVAVFEIITDRKRTQETIRSSQDQHRAILETAMDGFWMVDTMGRLLEVNEAYSRMSGYSAAELTQMNIADLEAEETADKVAARIQKITKLGADRFETRHRRKDGTIFDAEVSVQYRAAEGGRCWAFIRDITDRKKALEALAESESKFRSLFDSMTEGVALHEIVCGADGRPTDYRIVDVNHKFELYTGISVGSARGRLASEVYRTPVAPFLAEYSRVVATGRPEQFEAVYPPLAKTFAVSAYSPKPGWFATVFTDITERKRIEETLRSKTALLEAQMNVTIDGILVVDDRQKRILANRRIIKLFDVPRHVLENEDDAVLLEHVVGLAKNPDEFIEKVRYLYAHTAEIGRDEIEFKSGMILDRYSAPVIGVDGKNYGRIWIFRDITERKQAEKAVLDAVAAKATSEADKRRVAEIENAYEELERTKDMLAQYDKLAAVGELSAGVAHELNSPLTGILGIVRYYLRHKKPDDREYGDLKEVEEACERMSKIIRELLDFARPSMTERGQLDASRIIDSVLAFSKKAISEKGIELTANFEENLPPIRGNKSQLQQVCLNIVNNAVEAMSEKGELRISVKTVTVNGKNYVEMEFTDNGCGIDKENLGRVFNPFFTTKRPGKGTGLGLSIAYTIIKKHAGEIMAESPPAGHSIGTTFKIRIPEAVSAADEALGG